MHGQPQGDEPEETLPLDRQLVPLDVGPEVINHTSIEKADFAGNSRARIAGSRAPLDGTNIDRISHANVETAEQLQCSVCHARWVKSRIKDRSNQAAADGKVRTQAIHFWDKANAQCGTSRCSAIRSRPVKNAAIDAHRHPAPDGKVVKSSSTKTSCIVVKAWGIAPIREAIAIHAYHSVS